MLWIPFPDERLVCRGLPWWRENLPDLCRLPKRLAASLPAGVQAQSPSPSGGRISLRSDTSQVHLRLSGGTGNAADLDLYADGEFWGTAGLRGEEGEVLGFAGAARTLREITLYLPFRQPVRVVAVGVDEDAEFRPPARLAQPLPLVVYGSSVAQGAGASRPGLTYAALLARTMGLDFVNLGFGGAGKAEPEVVSLVAQVEACCYLLDLGKSYGYQPAAVYVAMLEALREAHPGTPVACLTPIFSAREFYSEEYVQLSQHTRAVVREAVAARIARGESRLLLIEGEDLLGRSGADGLGADRVHPNDLGESRIARGLHARLGPWLRELQGPAERSSTP